MCDPGLDTGLRKNIAIKDTIETMNKSEYKLWVRKQYINIKFINFDKCTMFYYKRIFLFLGTTHLRYLQVKGHNLFSAGSEKHHMYIKNLKVNKQLVNLGI